MPYLPRRPVSIAATWSRRLGQFSLALALTAWLFHRAGLLTLPNAVAVILLAAIVSLFVLGLSAIGFTMLWLSGAKGGRASFAGLVMAALVLGPVGYAASRYFLLPPLIEVSTDVADPPAWIEPPVRRSSWLGRPAPVTPELRARQLAAWPELAGRRYDGAMDRVLEAVNTVAEASKWELESETGADFLIPGRMPADGPEPFEPADPAASDEVADPADPGEESAAEENAGGVVLPDDVPLPRARPDIETIANPVRSPPVVVLQYFHHSLLLGVPHDIVVRLVEEEETTFVDVRAATRDGTHDLGLNARLAAGFLRDLDIALLGISGG